MRVYSFGKYSELVENSRLPILQNYMQAEIDFLSEIRDHKEKTFVDIGAGYGRVLPLLSKIGRNVIAIELNPNMSKELLHRANDQDNCIAIEGNLFKTEELLKDKDVHKPVVCLLQNSLGVIEGIDFDEYRKVLLVMKDTAKSYDGEIVISLFCQEGLRDFGMQLYTSVAEMTGAPDIMKTDFENGIMVSKTGYVSKWWTKAERQKIRDFFDGELVNEVLTENYHIMNIKV